MYKDVEREPEEGEGRKGRGKGREGRGGERGGGREKEHEGGEGVLFELQR